MDFREHGYDRTAGLLTGVNELAGRRVVHIYKTYFPDTSGGLEQAIRQICIGTQRLGANAVVATTTHGEPGEILRPEALVMRYRATIDVASTPISVSFWRDFRRTAASADIVHYHFPWPVADMMHLTAGVDRPSVVTYHSDIVRQRTLKLFYQPFMRRFLTSVRRIVVTSPNYLESSEDLRPYRNKCVVIPLAIDERSYLTPDTERMKYWISMLGDRFVLFVGVLRYYKGLEYLIRAMPGANYVLAIAGSGELERPLKRLANDLCAENVRFLGYISEEDKACLLRLCRAVVFPSQLRSEAFGMTLLEGAMYGKPLVSTELGTGTSYVNQTGVTGRVVPPADPAALRQAMDSLLNDDKRAQTMGAAARARFDRLFTTDRMGGAYAQLYRELLSD